MEIHWAARLRRALWISSFIALVGLMASSSRGQDDEPDVKDIKEDTRERLVLMTNGRMLTGQVTRNGGGYLIEQPNGRVQVTVEEVKFVVNDLREAYRKQRDSIVEPTPATHIALANWCISHRLHDEARDELKKCLKTDPENQEARRLLQRLTDTIRAALPPKQIEQTKPKTPDGFLQPDAESLGGLSKESAAQFTSRIQPLLLNKCGNASCHGMSSSNPFRLSQARMGSNGSRQNTERNLAETLKYIDLDNIHKSQLLHVTKGAHGGKGTIFVGPPGADQMRQLRDWARSMAHAKKEDEHEQEQQSKIASKHGPKKHYATANVGNSDVIQTAAYETSLEREPDVEPSESKDRRTKPRELKPDPTDATALALEPQDAFDPEEFNRRYRR